MAKGKERPTAAPKAAAGSRNPTSKPEPAPRSAKNAPDAPATRPTGVFRAERGSLVITRSGRQGISARFQMAAVGFTAAEPEQEDRRLSVRGAFTATPSR